MRHAPNISLEESSRDIYLYSALFQNVLKVFWEDTKQYNRKK